MITGNPSLQHAAGVQQIPVITASSMITGIRSTGIRGLTTVSTDLRASPPGHTYRPRSRLRQTDPIKDAVDERVHNLNEFL